MSELLFDFWDMLFGERHGNVRMYADDEVAYYVATSRCARRRIAAAGNCVWVWSEPMGSDMALVKSDATAPPEQRRYRRLTDTEDATAFELMLEEGVDPNSLVFRCLP